MNNRTILQGDVLAKLKEIPDGIIDCIISSPPYWGLRDYGVDGQLGLESDFRQYLEKMSVIMDELKRVLKKTGTCWINLGDTYSSSVTGSFNGGGKEFEGRNMSGVESSGNLDKSKLGIIPKSRFGIPERFYINCIDSGWIARNHIPWYKSNSMPSSVKDRFTNKWESVFFFAKEQKYYFNLDAVREKTITESKPFNIRVRENITGHAQAKLGDRSWNATDEEKERYNRDGTIKQYPENSNVSRLHKDRKQDSTLGVDGKPKANYAGFNDRWKSRKQAIDNGEHFSPLHYRGKEEYNPNGKNPGDVFFINPRPFPEAHFATFPVDLPLKILKCACPKDGMVLDPFFGAGTVGVAAEQLGLNWMGIELNEEYIKIARKRLEPFLNEKLG